VNNNKNHFFCVLRIAKTPKILYLSFVENIMQTIEFNAIIEDGVIPIPELYKNKIPSRVKVILTEDAFLIEKK
jgi:hypothetical protein